jgi:hypothetical protein
MTACLVVGGIEGLVPTTLLVLGLTGSMSLALDGLALRILALVVLMGLVLVICSLRACRHAQACRNNCRGCEFCCKLHVAAPFNPNKL